MPAVIHSEIAAAGILCPACDPRSIGLADDGERRWVYRHLLVGGDVLFRCGRCGGYFNPGTTREHGAKAEPLARATVDALIKPGDCRCASSAMWRAYDLNYRDDAGVEHRVHGFACLHCGRWAQYG